MDASPVSPARVLAYRAGVFIAALVGGMIVALPVAVLGLVVPEYVTQPLALIAGGLVSGISAGWAANLLAPDRTRSILLPIAEVSVATGGVIAAAGMVFSMIGLWPVFPNVFSALLLSMIIISISASVAAWHFRSIVGRLTRDILTTLGLLGVAAVFIAGTVLTTCSLVSCTP